MQAAHDRERQANHRVPGEGPPMPTYANVGEDIRAIDDEEILAMKTNDSGWQTAAMSTEEQKALEMRNILLHRKRMREEQEAADREPSGDDSGDSNGVPRAKRRAGTNAKAKPAPKVVDWAIALQGVDISDLTNAIADRATDIHETPYNPYEPITMPNAAELHGDSVSVALSISSSNQLQAIITQREDAEKERLRALRQGSSRTRPPRMSRFKKSGKRQNTSVELFQKLSQTMREAAMLRPLKYSIARRNNIGARTLDDCHMVMDSIFKLLDTLRNPNDAGKIFVRTKNQRSIHKMIIGIMFPGVYGDLWVEENIPLILHRYGYDNYRGEVAITTPRQCGKSTAMCMLLSVVIMCCPNLECAIFAQGQKNSNKIIEDTYNIIATMPGGEELVTAHNKSFIEMRMPGGCDRRTITGYASTPDSARGFSAWLILVDEGASINPQTMYKAIMPVAIKSKSGLAVVSTVTNEDNMMTQLMKVEDPGSPDGKLFLSKSVVESCDECLKGPDPAGCTHLEELAAPWKDVGKASKFKAVMGRAIADSENGGFVVMDHKRAFSEQLVNEFRDRLVDISTLSGTPSVVYVSFDPSGGGQSQVAGIARVYYRSRHNKTNVRSVVVGVGISDNMIDRDDRHKFLGEFYSALRQHVGCESCIIVNAFEGNMQQQASNMADYIVDNGDENMFVMREVKRVNQAGHATKRAAHKNSTYGPGVMKNWTNTDEAQGIFAGELRDGTCFFSDKMVAICGDRVNRQGIVDNTDRAREHNRNLLAVQLNNFRIDAKTGKIHGKREGGVPDDAAVALIMTGPYKNLFWNRRDNPEQRKIQERILRHPCKNHGNLPGDADRITGRL